MITKIVHIEEDREVLLPIIGIDLKVNDIYGTFSPHDHAKFNLKDVDDEKMRDKYIEVISDMVQRLYAIKKIEVAHVDVTNDIQTIVATKMAEEIVK